MNEQAPHQVETPSGKGAGDENFPVGSFLLPRRLRPQVALFYAYARAIDDIADNPELAPEEKVARLDGFDRALAGKSDDPAYEKGIRIRETMGDVGGIVQHCRDLLVAFKADATKLRYTGWDDLMWYCRYSAAPVGRFLLDLHGEDPADYPPSDALCAALQVINHLQDCQDDYRALNRVYIPEPWLIEQGLTVEALGEPAASPALRTVLDRCLDGTETLMDEARALPRALKSRRLAMESAAIVRLADKLIAMLRRQDPLATRVELSKPGFLLNALIGVGKYWLTR